MPTMLCNDSSLYVEYYFVSKYTCLQFCNSVKLLRRDIFFSRIGKRNTLMDPSQGSMVDDNSNPQSCSFLCFENLVCPCVVLMQKNTTREKRNFSYPQNIHNNVLKPRMENSKCNLCAAMLHSDPALSYRKLQTRFH
ncbi:Protein of unknown function [Gryllus bimaculatus]|nr:Protein of unknown function [Gryllus bimaculatus]